MTDKLYTLEQIKSYLQQHMSEEQVLDTLKFLEGQSAMELYLDETDDYSGDIMGCFKRVYG